MPDEPASGFDLGDRVDTIGAALALGELLGVGLIEDAEAVALDAGEPLEAHARGEHQSGVGVAAEVVGSGGGESLDRLADRVGILQRIAPACPAGFDPPQGGDEVAGAVVAPVGLGPGAAAWVDEERAAASSGTVRSRLVLAPLRISETALMSARVIDRA